MAKPDLKVLEGGRSKASTPTRAPRAKTLAQAVASDDPVAEVKAVRAILARRIADPKTSAVAIAALTKQFRELGEQIAAGTESTVNGSATRESVGDEEWDADDL